MLYLTYSALAGIGGGVIYAGNIGNTVKFFPDKRGLAAGLCAAGYGCGAMLVAPIASALIINYGVLNTFQILGTAFFIIIAICIMFIKKAPAGYKPAGWTPPVVAATAAQPAGNDSKWTQMISEGIWWVVMIMLFCGAMSGLMVLAHASPIGQIMFKLTPMNAAFFVSIITLANALGRVGFGALSDRIGRSNTIMIMYIVSALSMLNLAFPQRGRLDASVSEAVLCLADSWAPADHYQRPLLSEELRVNYGSPLTAQPLPHFGP